LFWNSVLVESFNYEKKVFAKNHLLNSLQAKPEEAKAPELEKPKGRSLRGKRKKADEPAEEKSEADETTKETTKETGKETGKPNAETAKEEPAAKKKATNGAANKVEVVFR
jgi:uncharacterized membrane protein